jgi:mannose-1-phosphate guanylyltransferase
MRAMILAAGLGTRLRPLTDVRPKVLAPVMGVPLLDFWISQLGQAGFEAVVINAHHLAEKLVAAVRGRDWPLPVEVAVERGLLGTAGGIRNVLEFFGHEPFVVVNGDVICQVNFVELYQQHMQAVSPVSMLLHDWPAFNNVAVADGVVRGFGKESSTFPQEQPEVRRLAFTGIHVIDPAVLRPLPREQAAEIIPIYRQLMDAGKPPQAIVSRSLFWREIGSVKAYRAVHDELATLPQKDLAPLQTGQAIFIHPQAEVSPRAELRGMVAIGKGTRVRGGAILENSILWDHVTVQANSLLRDCIVADGVEVQGSHINKTLIETVI